MMSITISKGSKFKIKVSKRDRQILNENILKKSPQIKENKNRKVG